LVRRRHKFISYRKENKERRRELLCRVKKEDEAHLKKQGSEADALIKGSWREDRIMLSCRLTAIRRVIYRRSQIKAGERREDSSRLCDRAIGEFPRLRWVFVTVDQ
jgi:hypothetical protein